jgi:hypothetical protein
MFKNFAVAVFTTLIYAHYAPGQLPTLEKQDSLFVSLFEQAFRYEQILWAKRICSPDSGDPSLSDRLNCRPVVYRIVRREVQTPRGRLTLIGGLVKRIFFERMIKISVPTQVKSLALDSIGSLYFLEGFKRDDRFLLAHNFFGGAVTKRDAMRFGSLLLQSQFPEYMDLTVVDSTNFASLHTKDPRVALPEVRRKGGALEVTFVLLELSGDTVLRTLKEAIRIRPGGTLEVTRKQLPATSLDSQVHPK